MAVFLIVISLAAYLFRSEEASWLITFLLCIVFFALGIICSGVSLHLFRSSQVEFVVDCEGVWCQGGKEKGFGHQLWLIPWQEILNIETVTHSSWDDDHEYIVFSLSDDAYMPIGSRREKFRDYVKREMKRVMSDQEIEHPWLIDKENPFCTWNPDEFEAFILRYYQDPDLRAELGAYQS